MKKYKVIDSFGVNVGTIVYSDLKFDSYIDGVEWYFFYKNEKKEGFSYSLPLKAVEEITEEDLIGKYVELVGESLEEYKNIMGEEKCLGGVFGYVFSKYSNLDEYKININGFEFLSAINGFKVVEKSDDKNETTKIIYDMLNLKFPKTEKIEVEKLKKPIKISKKTEKLVKEIELWHIENAIDKSLENGDYLSIPKLIESRRLLEQR